MKSLLDGYYRVLKVTLTCLMGLMIVPVIMQVVSRFTDLLPRYIWTEEVARFCFVWIIMIGSMIAVRDGTHFDVDLLPKPKRFRNRGILKLVRHFSMFALAIVFLVYGIDFAIFGMAQSSEMSGVNMLSIYITFPLAGLTWILFLLEKLALDFKQIRSSGEQELEA